MIFELNFGFKKEYAQAESLLLLFQEYEREFDNIQDIEDVREISDDLAKTIMLKNTEYDENDPEDKSEISLFELAKDSTFIILGSTEYD